MIPKIDIRTIIIILLAVVLFFSLDGCSRVVKLFEGEEVVKEKTTTTIDTSFVERKYLDIQPFPEIFKPTPQKVEIKKGKVREVPNTTPVDSTQERVVKEVNKYETVTELPNGIIKGKFLVEGELLSTELELLTKDQVITNETETVRTVVQSGLFAGVISVVGIDGRIKQVGPGLTYVHKNQWFIQAGLQYDVDPLIKLPAHQRAGVSVGLHFKL